MSSVKRKGTVPDFFVTRDREFTIAFGIYADEGIGVVPFAGATKKNPQDNENKARGERLAVGNAFRQLGRVLLKNEYDAIHLQYHSKPKKKKKTEELARECEETCCETVYAEDDVSNAYGVGYTIGYEEGYNHGYENSDKGLYER